MCPVWVLLTKFTFHEASWKHHRPKSSNGWHLLSNNCLHSCVYSDPTNFHGLWALGISQSFCNKFSNEGVWLSCSGMFWFETCRVSFQLWYFSMKSLQTSVFQNSLLLVLLRDGRKRTLKEAWETSLRRRWEQRPERACLVSSLRGISGYHCGYTKGAYKAQEVIVGGWIDTLVSSRKVLCFLTLLTSDGHTEILPFASRGSSTGWLQTLQQNSILFCSIWERY